MASWTESPLVQSLSISVLNVLRRQAGVGTSPAASGPTSTPVPEPKPMLRDQRWSGESLRS